MSLIHVTEWKSSISIDSDVRFQELTNRHVVASPDRTSFVRMGRLLKAIKPETLNLFDFTGEAGIELTTSDQRVADLLRIKCWSREYIAYLAEHTCQGTNTLLEPVELNGRVSFKCHLCNDGLESVYGEKYNFNAYHKPHKELALSVPTCFITIGTDPSLYVDYEDYAQHMAKALEYFLNDAYVYQLVQNKHVSEWKFGTLPDICRLVGRDYREVLYPHIMNACSFMTERAAFA